MNPKSRAFRPGAASLEPRVLLSAAEVANPAFTKFLTSASLQGRYQAGQDHRAADAPLQVKVSGTGTMQGKAKLSGTLQFGGFRVANAPDINGTMTVTDAKGTMKLRIAGSGGNAQLPGNQFTVNAGIVRGTGSYAHAQGIGTATLAFGANTLRGKAAAGPVTITLDLDVPVR